VGGWLEDRKKEILQELKLDAAPVLSAEEIENATVAPSEKVKTTIAFLERYREQLKKVKKAAVSNENVFECLMEASKFCSLGQLTLALYEVGGQYRRNM
jgi:methylmalonyl-CoA mutase